MKAFFPLLAYIIMLPAIVSGQNLEYPVDVIYHPESARYFVTNWNQQGAGSIFTVDEAGNITGVFYSGLKYPGGMAIVDDILFVTNNFTIINFNKPSYLVGIDLNTGQQTLNRLIDADNCYLDLMDTDGTNIYIGNSAGNVVYKYNIPENTLQVLAESTLPYGVCYDYIHDRVLYIESGYTNSRIHSVKPDGTGKEILLSNFSGYLEGIIMDFKGRFYYSSWGDNPTWGDERVFTNNSTFSDQQILSSGHNRPFGMCIMPGKKLYVCNWGGNSFSFIDLSEFLPVEEKPETQSGIITLAPNPCRGKTTISINGLAGKTGTVSITSVQGKTLISNTLVIREDEYRMETDLSALPEGIYFVIFKTDGFLTTQKLIIQ